MSQSALATPWEIADRDWARNHVRPLLSQTSLENKTHRAAHLILKLGASVKIAGKYHRLDSQSVAAMIMRAKTKYLSRELVGQDMAASFPAVIYWINTGGSCSAKEHGIVLSLTSMRALWFLGKPQKKDEAS